MSLKKVQVLMSTYNGEKYLKVQLESILNQDYKNISILIRDDGSSDQTVKILEEYAKNHSNIEVYSGENVGVIQSFFDLIQKADGTADYFALSDQDDFWLENKIATAVKKLSKSNGDRLGLYCGSQTLVDQNLNALKVQIKEPRIKPSFGNALVENIAAGCTSVFNKKALTILRQHIPEYTIMHDWWIYLMVSCFGDVYYDSNSYILYRQHNNNVVGSRNTYWNEFKARVIRFRDNRGKILKQIRAFQKSFQIGEHNKRLLDIMLHYQSNIIQRIKGIVSNRIHRQRIMDNIIFKMLFFTNHI